MSHRYILAISLTAALLSGCASPPPTFAPAEGAPTANLKSAIGKTDSIKVDIEIGVVEENKRMPTRLFVIDKYETRPAGSMKVPANGPLILTFFENSSGAPLCRHTIQVELKEGKSYTLSGGTSFKPNPNPFLRATRFCELKVIDDETQKPIPYQPATTNLPWFAQ